MIPERDSVTSAAWAAYLSEKHLAEPLFVLLSSLYPLRRVFSAAVEIASPLGWLIWGRERTEYMCSRVLSDMRLKRFMSLLRKR